MPNIPNTPRGRSDLLQKFAPNISGDISDQELRDLIVTLMPMEFQNPSDYWAEPDPVMIQHGDWRGWAVYSQRIESDCVFGHALYLTNSGTWALAGTSAHSEARCMGLATNSYSAGNSVAVILRKGIIYATNWSNNMYGNFHRPVFLLTNAGTWSITSGGDSISMILGYVEMPAVPRISTDTGVSVITSCSDYGWGKWRFDPQWGIYNVL